MIWALPFVLAIGGPLGRLPGRFMRSSMPLTFLIYPLLFHRGLLPLQMPAILILNLRNALLIALWLLMAFGREPEECTP